MLHNAYRDWTERPHYLTSEANADIYRDDTWSGTIKSMAGSDLETRRAVYFRRSITSDDFVSCYLPIDRDEENLLPMYVSIRGTDDIWDIFKDVNFLMNYGTNSSLNITGYNSKLTTLYNDIIEAMNVYAGPLVLISHSLGSMYAMDLWRLLFNNPIHSTRLHKNVMFNPFLIINDNYSLLATYPPLFKNTIEAHIIDGDMASVVYKNHPIHPTGLTIYENIVERDGDGWIQSAVVLSRFGLEYMVTGVADLNYIGSLQVRNHQLSAFTEEFTQYPEITEVAYDMAGVEQRRIRSSRAHFTMTATRPAGSVPATVEYTNQTLYLEYDHILQKYLANNPVMESTNLDYYDLHLSIKEKRDMIYRHDQWSFPLWLDTDYGEIWYLFKTGYTSPEAQTGYYLALQATPNSLSYLRTWIDVDQTNRLRNQESTTNESVAYETISEGALEAVITDNVITNMFHLRHTWYVMLPPLDVTPHTGYGLGERRSLADSVDPYLPVHGKYYNIRHAHLNNRILGIFRQPAATALHPLNEGILTVTYPGNYFETLDGNSMNSIFQCNYDPSNNKYSFLDIKYLDDNTTGGIIDPAYEVYIGESNVFHHNWGGTLSTPNNNIGFELIENNTTNVSVQAAYTGSDLFLLKQSGAFLMVNNSWVASQGPENDSFGSLDPITSSDYNLPPDYWGLFKFEEVTYP